MMQAVWARNGWTRLGQWVAAALIALAYGAGLCHAQSARNLGMGGVGVPDETASLRNPAYAASEFVNRTVLPLPLGGINLIPFTNFIQGIEAAALFEQGTHLSSAVLNLPQAPELVELAIFAEDMGVVLAAIDIEGGSPLRLDTSGFHHQSELNLPVDVRFDFASLGLRPFGYLNTVLTTNEGFRDLFADGSTEAALDVAGEAGAGLALDLTLAEDFFPDVSGLGVFVGTRFSPYLGLAHATVSGSGSTRVAIDGSNLAGAEAAYNYDLTYFLSSGLGYGFTSDLGLAIRLGETRADHADFGIGVSGLGVGVWQGLETHAEGTGILTEGTSQEAPIAKATRSIAVSPTARMTLNFGYTFAASPASAVLLAADASLSRGLLSAHLGSELATDIGPDLSLALRGGAGYENGGVFGAGIGLTTGTTAFDLALHAYPGVFTREQLYGLALTITF